MGDDLMSVVYVASVCIIPVLLVVTLHEVAHGWTAGNLGDYTARAIGRVTFNSLRHIELAGMVALPGLLLIFSAPFMFGWAKPVPVNFTRLRDPKQAMVIVAAAGPAKTFGLAYLLALCLSFMSLLPSEAAVWVSANLINLIKISVVLAVFNLLLLSPLNGGRVSVGLLPSALASLLARFEMFGFAIIIAIIFVLPFMSSQLGQKFDPFAWLVIGPVNYVARLIAIAAGIQ